MSFMHVLAHMWRSKDNFLGVFSLLVSCRSLGKLSGLGANVFTY